MLGHIHRGHLLTPEQTEILLRVINQFFDQGCFGKAQAKIEDQFEAACSVEGYPLPPGTGPYTLTTAQLEAHRNSSTEERSWAKDRPLENGNYGNLCLLCKGDFVGHKRRHVCYLCSTSSKSLKEGLK